jgi:hypothetical protein
VATLAERRRRPLDELIAQTPADGLVTGVGTVNAAQFGAERARCAVMAYDYTVLAGTQGVFNHRKSDRLLELAGRLKWPVVLFAEGGGGRPGDVDRPIVAGLDCTTFARWAALAGRVPRVGIAAGRCFAGNAALLGCSDVSIATESASIGMGGPAMIEGGGLGGVAPESVGPVSVLAPNGAVDLRVADEAAAVAAASQYLGYFQGPLPPGEAADQTALPENRNVLYDPRAIVRTLADAGSVMELRAEFGASVITALARIEGRPVALAASHPRHLAGALDTPACDKLARFMQLHGEPPRDRRRDRSRRDPRLAGARPPACRCRPGAACSTPGEATIAPPCCSHLLYALRPSWTLRWPTRAMPCSARTTSANCLASHPPRWHAGARSGTPCRPTATCATAAATAGGATAASSSTACRCSRSRTGRTGSRSSTTRCTAASSACSSRCPTRW